MSFNKPVRPTPPKAAKGKTLKDAKESGRLRENTKPIVKRKKGFSQVPPEPQCDGGQDGLAAIIAPYAEDDSDLFVNDTMTIPDYADGKSPIERTLESLAEAPLFDTIVSPINGAVYDVRLFDFSMIGEDFTIVNWGKRRSGKSLWTKAFMRACRFRFKDVVVFTGSYYDYEYVDLVPENQIIDGLDNTKLKALIKMQEDDVARIQKTGINDDNISLLIILDDVLGEGLRYRADLERLFFNGRHLKVSLVINLQDTKGIPPMMRSNTDIAISYVMRSQRDKEAMRENFADFLQNDNDWDAVMAPLLEMYSFMFVGFITSTPQLKQCASVTVGIAPVFEQGDNDPPMVMGTRACWNDNAEQLLRMKNGWMLLMGTLDDDWGVITKFTPGFVGTENIWTPALEPMPQWFVERSMYSQATAEYATESTQCRSANAMDPTGRRGRDIHQYAQDRGLAGPPRT
jgi:hypothetical protein